MIITFTARFIVCVALSTNENWFWWDPFSLTASSSSSDITDPTDPADDFRLFLLGLAGPLLAGAGPDWDENY